MDKKEDGGSIQIVIDFTNLKYDEKTTKKIIKNLSRTRKRYDLFHKAIKIKKINCDEIEIHKIFNQYQFSIMVAIQAVQIQDKKERLNYLYDEICFYLDNICITNNLCEFKDSKCFVKRNTDVTMGCCHRFPNKKWGIFYQKEMIPCEYLGEKGCTTKAIGCKMFMCDEIIKKGYKFTVFNVLLIKYFFNIIQKYIVRTSIFNSKENIMKNLLKYNF